MKIFTGKERNSHEFSSGEDAIRFHEPVPVREYPEIESLCDDRNEFTL